MAAYAAAQQLQPPGTGMPLNGGHHLHHGTRAITSAPEARGGGGGPTGKIGLNHSMPAAGSPVARPLKAALYALPAIGSSGMVLPCLGQVAAGAGADHGGQPPGAEVRFGLRVLVKVKTKLQLMCFRTFPPLSQLLVGKQHKAKM